MQKYNDSKIYSDNFIIISLYYYNYIAHGNLYRKQKNGGWTLGLKINM